MRKLAVCVNFMSEPYRSRIEKAAAELNFEAAAELRDKLVELKKVLNDL